MLGNRSRSGEASAPTSFDSEHLRSISRGSNGTSSHQRSNSAEGQQGYKRWSPYTSPVPIHRMQQKPYVPTNLSGKETNNGRQSPPSQLSSIPSQESRRVSDSDRMNVDEGGEVDSAQHAGSKRKDREEEAGGEKRANDQTEVAASLSRFSTLAPPSSHLYSNMEKARQERNSAIDDQRKGRQASEGAQEQDELEDDDSDEARNRATRTVDGVVHALVPQRKSCDRCFKMKTKVGAFTFFSHWVVLTNSAFSLPVLSSCTWSFGRGALRWLCATGIWRRLRHLSTRLPVPSNQSIQACKKRILAACSAGPQ